ncbi:MAG: choice-of-anchor B family protein [Phaeodactylibacter sp.]|nr:choice-of-anchor B family protein [Phaeodactylibacter sp.]MCB9293978.1 choice-of-anchor B family protein [Lewinellaceae bacterium]
MNTQRSLTLLFCLALALSLPAQESLNVELFAQYNRGDGRASGSWSYVAPDGSEYAVLGAQTGTAIVKIDDPEDIREAGFVPGYSSNWREVIVVGGHAYVVTEGSGFPHYGMQVIDLTQLPDTAFLLAEFSETFGRGHIIQKDIFSEAPYVYVCGTQTTQGVHIIDVSDPAQPEEVGVYQPGYYIHDCHVRDTLLFAAAFYEGVIDIVSIADKANPRLIASIEDPGGNTHSFSTTEEVDYLFVADEQDGLPGRIFNIEELDNPREVATWTANSASLVHNPYIRGDFAFISHNTEGLRVLDIADPAVPVETGFYDTYTGPSGGFQGLWSACPYLPSGKIIGGNRADGLYVWTFNNTRAGRFYGQVVDSLSRAPIFNAIIQVEEAQDLFTSDIQGEFKRGYLPGTYTLRVIASGYPSKTVSITLAEGSREQVLVELAPEVNSAGGPAREEARIEVSPNPVGEQAAVQLVNMPGAEWAVLLNAGGQEVERFNINGMPNFTVERQGKTAGAYWLVVYGKGGMIIGNEMVVIGR